MEADEQRAVIEYCEYKHIPIFHIPNEGKRSYMTARKLREQGLKRGVPDLFLPEPHGSYHGLFIEMKFGKNTLTEAQKRWCRILSANGYAVLVCWTAEAAIKGIVKYRRLTNDK